MVSYPDDGSVALIVVQGFHGASQGLEERQLPRPDFGCRMPISSGRKNKQVAGSLKLVLNQFVVSRICASAANWLRIMTGIWASRGNRVTVR